MFLLSFVPVLLLLVAAWGLRNGRRFARWLAIAVNVAILVFARTAFEVTVTTADVEDGTWSVFDLGELIVWALAVLALPIGIIVMLVVTRRHFQIRSPHVPFVRFVVTVTATFVVLAVVYFVIGLVDHRRVLAGRHRGRPRDRHVQAVRAAAFPRGASTPSCCRATTSRASRTRRSARCSGAYFIVAAVLLMRQSDVDHPVRRFREASAGCSAATAAAPSASWRPGRATCTGSATTATPRSRTGSSTASRSRCRTRSAPPRTPAASSASSPRSATRTAGCRCSTACTSSTCPCSRSSAGSTPRSARRLSCVRRASS